VDVARAASLLLASPFGKGEKFILVSDNLPYKELFGMIARSVNAKAPSRVPPAFLARWAGRAAEMWAGMTGKPPLISKETATLSRGQFHYDGSRITRELDFQYSPLPEIIQQTGKQYLTQHGA
jgi:nucleoside-diphosphate-sugar epimerase